MNDDYTPTLAELLLGSHQFVQQANAILTKKGAPVESTAAGQLLLAVAAQEVVLINLIKLLGLEGREVNRLEVPNGGTD